MRPVLQAFASGIFAAVLIVAVTYYTGDASSETGTTPSEPTTEEMIEKLRNSNYVIHTEEEWEQEKSQESNEETNSEDPVTVRAYDLTVSEGMSSKEISEKLQDASIIEDADAFNNYLMDNNLSQSIQTGTFIVDDQMEPSELAEVLTSN